MNPLQNDPLQNDPLQNGPGAGGPIVGPTNKRFAEKSEITICGSVQEQWMFFPFSPGLLCCFGKDIAPKRGEHCRISGRRKKS